MLDPSHLDAMFDAAVKLTGTAPSSDLMNPRVLFPLSVLPTAVERETGHKVSLEAVETMASDAWFRVHEGAGEAGGEPGVLMIVPSRVGLLLDLRAGRWEASELSATARYEDEMIEWIYTSEELEYPESPQALLVQECLNDAEMIDLDIRRLEGGGDFEQARRFVAGRGLQVSSPKELPLIAERMRRRASFYRELDWEALPLDRRRPYERAAFGIAIRDDWVRLQMLEADRSKVRAGFSIFMTLHQESWGEECGFAGSDVMWDTVVQSPWLLEQDEPRVRVPGAILEGMEVRLTESPSPAEYDRLFREFRLDRYFERWAAITKSRVCQHCYRPLPPETDARRRYCDDACRNSAKQRRYRERHPDRVFDAQVSYYSQFAKDEAR